MTNHTGLIVSAPNLIRPAIDGIGEPENNAAILFFDEACHDA